MALTGAHIDSKVPFPLLTGDKGTLNLTLEACALGLPIVASPCVVLVEGSWEFHFTAMDQMPGSLAKLQLQRVPYLHYL